VTDPGGLALGAAELSAPDELLALDTPGVETAAGPVDEPPVVVSLASGSASPPLESDVQAATNDAANPIAR
jgi:hypothetical protein